ncbi:Hsp20/alpha crystallin family protein [Peribacillus loiseleuriae]|uniref:Hsp20/alpha crystallin family protein n=1 Tax=Peribacillus loiseleuriae TaxID=1679170 RepID=UPI003D03DA64
MFPWSSLFSFQKNSSDKIKHMNPNDIQSFMNQIFSQAMPDQMQQFMNQQNPNSNSHTQQNTSSDEKLQTAVFETHSDVYVRILIKDSTCIRNLKIYHTSNQLLIDGIPGCEEKLVTTLPCIVKKKGTTAQYKNETLEIRLAKQQDIQFSEIDVSEI